MGINAAAVQSRQLHDLRNDLFGVRSQDAQSSHSRIELEMAFGGSVLTDRFRTDFFRAVKIGNAEDQTIGNGGFPFGIEHPAEDLDRLAEIFQEQRFFQRGGTEPGGAGIQQHFRDRLTPSP